MIGGLAGYAVSFPLGQSVELLNPLMLIIGLYLLSSGSFAINQAQEWQSDVKMARTASRPLPAGEMQLWQAYTIGVIFCVVGSFLLYLLSSLAAGVGLLTIVLYNGLYTLYWKKNWAFGAVPGAIPGAMPVVIGYAVNTNTLLESQCVYLFLIMFLWQMPHFWALAVRYKNDYALGGFPVLPLKIGVDRTLYHIGLYTFAYVGVAVAAPLFVSTHVSYLLLIIPLSVKVLWEFFRYFHSENQKMWLPFFLWVNLSMLVFICVPVFDKWFFYFTEMMG